jgi:diaminopimelate epimerase
MAGNSIRFTKMSGSGNDFIVIDDRAGRLHDVDVSAMTRSISRHRLSVGADGVVLISEPPAGDSTLAYAWRYINADGTDGEMCGNGAMCAARFAVRSGIAESHHRFLTESGAVEAWVDAESGVVTIAIADPGPVEAPVSVTVLDRNLECTRIMVGVPHVVIVADDADAFADAESFHAIGRALRLHPVFAPAGTNANVVSRIDDCTWRMRTYERGVEAETLACGTGAVASAIVLGAKRMAPNPVQIRTSSGRDLSVSYETSGRGTSDVRLSGHAAVIYDGVLGPDAILS